MALKEVDIYIGTYNEKKKEFPGQSFFIVLFIYLFWWGGGVEVSHTEFKETCVVSITFLYN